MFKPIPQFGNRCSPTFFIPVCFGKKDIMPPGFFSLVLPVSCKIIVMHNVISCIFQNVRSNWRESNHTKHVLFYVCILVVCSFLSPCHILILLSLNMYPLNLNVSNNISNKCFQRKRCTPQPTDFAVQVH